MEMFEATNLFWKPFGSIKLHSLPNKKKEKSQTWSEKKYLPVHFIFPICHSPVQLISSRHIFQLVLFHLQHPVSWVFQKREHVFQKIKSTNVRQEVPCFLQNRAWRSWNLGRGKLVTGFTLSKPNIEFQAPSWMSFTNEAVLHEQLTYWSFKPFEKTKWRSKHAGMLLLGEKIQLHKFFFLVSAQLGCYEYWLNSSPFNVGLNVLFSLLHARSCVSSMPDDDVKSRLQQKFLPHPLPLPLHANSPLNQSNPVKSSSDSHFQGSTSQIQRKNRRRWRTSVLLDFWKTVMLNKVAWFDDRLRQRGEML